MKCHFGPKSWSNRATPKLLFNGRVRVPWKPWTFTPSHCDPAWQVELDAGMLVFQICETMGFSPKPRGSTEARLYVCPVSVSVNRPFFRFAEGTFRLKVSALGKRKPS